MAAALSVLVLVGCATDRPSAAVVQPAPALERSDEPNLPVDRSPAGLLAERWGIKIEAALLSAGGYMIDFRFRVLDAAKATPILQRTAHPYLVDQATGAVFAVPNAPKIGQLRSGGGARPGRTYFILFANPARYIKSGNKVTVVVGDFQVRDITIQ